MVERVVGLEGVRTAVAFMQTPDGHGQLELIKFHTPSHQGDNRNAQANAPGIRHVAFAVDNIDAVVASLRGHGAELVGEVERYQDSYRLLRPRPGGDHVELAEQGCASIRECLLRTAPVSERDQVAPEAIQILALDDQGGQTTGRLQLMLFAFSPEDRLTGLNRFIDATRAADLS